MEPKPGAPYKAWRACWRTCCLACCGCLNCAPPARAKPPASAPGVATSAKRRRISSTKAPAAEALTAGLKDTPISAPKIPVISNVDVEAHGDADTIRATLAKQLTSPVQWEKTMTTLLEKGLEASAEVGPGKVISGIMKRIDKTAACDNFTV